MKSLGEEIPGYKLREIIKEVDTDRNGTIEFNEFVNVSRTGCDIPLAIQEALVGKNQ